MSIEITQRQIREDDLLVTALFTHPAIPGRSARYQMAASANVSVAQVREKVQAAYQRWVTYGDTHAVTGTQDLRRQRLVALSEQVADITEEAGVGGLNVQIS